MDSITTEHVPKALDSMQSEFAQAKENLKDEEDKKALVLDALLSKCTKDSEHAVIRDMAAAMEDTEGNLDAELVSGGKTNFSFKVFVDTNKSMALYAKIFLPYALWDQDRTFRFDTGRAVSEYDMMQKLSLAPQNAAGCKVATPLFLLDVPGDAKIVVAEWATGTEEQWGNQFIDGSVDGRVVKKVAQALAQLNLQEIDHDWNNAVRPGLTSINSIVKTVFNRLNAADEDDSDALMMKIKGVGQERFYSVVDKYCQQLEEQRQVLCHNDCHPFNVLVESKPMGVEDVSEVELDLLDATAESEPSSDRFGPNGDFLICDWETAICGPAGKDAGIFMFFPSACSLCLAAQGHTAESLHLLDCNIAFWNTYSEVISSSESKKEEHELVSLFRVALGTLGAYLLIHLYILGVLVDTLPLNDTSENDTKRIRGSIGLVGLKLLLLSFDDENKDTAETGPIDTFSGLQEFYKQIMSEQIEILSECSGPSSNLRVRSSFLRGENRRVSDASAPEEASTRISSHNLDWSNHRRVKAFESTDFGASMCSFVDDDMLGEDFEVTDEMRKQWEADLLD